MKKLAAFLTIISFLGGLAVGTNLGGRQGAAISKVPVEIKTVFVDRVVEIEPTLEYDPALVEVIKDGTAYRITSKRKASKKVIGIANCDMPAPEVSVAALPAPAGEDGISYLSDSPAPRKRFSLSLYGGQGPVGYYATSNPRNPSTALVYPVQGPIYGAGVRVRIYEDTSMGYHWLSNGNQFLSLDYSFDFPFGK